VSIEACSVGQLLVESDLVNGSGKLATETRTVSGFERIRLNGLGAVTIQIGEGEGLQIEAEDNLLPYIESTVENGTLVIRTRDHTNLNITRDIRYTIQVKSLTGLDLSGASTARVEGALRVETLQVTLSGASSLVISEMQEKTFALKCSGTGCAHIAGEVEQN